MATVTGTTGDDTLTGTGGDDIISGGDGADTLTGDTGGGGSLTVTRVSTSSGGAEGNGGSTNPKLSPDATMVVFASAANNLVAGDTNGVADIFVVNLATGAVTLISSAADGSLGNGASGSPVFSPDGTKVMFTSAASNLVAGDTNGVNDTFIKDLVTGAVTLVSIDASGARGNGNSFAGSFSADGTKVLFSSAATNWVSGDSNASNDVFLKDLVTGAITAVSTSAAGAFGNAGGTTPLQGGGLSSDGTLAVISSSSSALVAGDTNSASDIFVKNLTTGAITLVSKSVGGTIGNNLSVNPVISADGTKVAFQSNASNLVAGDTNGRQDIFVVDLATGVVTLVSTDAGGGQADGSSQNPRFTSDGGSIVFRSSATNLVAGDTNGRDDIYLKNLSTGAITRLSLTHDGGEPTGADVNATDIAGDGSKVAYSSSVTNIVAGDTNAAADIFVATLPSGGAGNDRIDGGAGDDIINGGAGADYIKGGLGADTMRGGTGNDTYVVDDLGDTTDETGGDGIDLVHSKISWTLAAGLENLTLGNGSNLTGTGNALANVITGNSLANTLSGLAGADTLNGGGGNDILNGGDDDDTLNGDTQNDTLNGGAGADTLNGGAHNDTLDGGTGADTMTGGTGHDSYVVDHADDTVIEAAAEGTDTISASVSFDIAANVENIILTGSGDIQSFGNALANIMTGNSGANHLVGGGGHDTLSGMDGDDSMLGDTGNDILIGGNGVDALSGEAGSDRLTGGAGADLFMFWDTDMRRSALGQTTWEDTITDIDFAGGDRIDLSAIDANVLTLGVDEAFTFVARLTGVAGQAAMTFSGGRTFVRFDVDGDGKADLTLILNGDQRASQTDVNATAADGGWYL